jgi:hypothetical protein
MTKYLYTFGYCTPQQAEANDLHGWDDEDSAGVLICATSERAAQDWGRSIAEEFLKRLYNDRHASWAADGYGDGIELIPSETYAVDQLQGIPEVQDGEFPDWTTLLG